MRVLAVAVGLLMLAGCASPKAATERPADGTTIDVDAGDGTNQTVVVGADLGVVSGQVFTDAGAKLPGARVSLLRTSFFADTDAEGRFRFVNVTAGTHELSVLASGFLPDRREIVVREGAATAVEIVLLADVGDAASRAHTHDHWGTDTAITLMDDPYELTVDENRGADVPGYSDVNYALVQPNQNGTVFPLILPDGDARPPIIFPGTGTLAITVSWDATEVQLDHLGLVYTAPSVPGRVVLPPVKQGGTWSINVNSTMWDGGHAPFTAWRFNLYYGNSAQSSTTNWKPGAVLGPIHVLVVVTKGAQPPQDPPHEDFWAAGNVLDLPVKAVVTWVGPDTSRSRPEEQLTLADNSIVPPGTTRLRLEFSYVLQSPADAAAGKRYVLTWRTADLHWYHTPLSAYATAASTAGANGSQVYEFPVQPGQTDGYYQSRSNWAFVPARAGAQGETAEYHVGGIEFRLKVTALRDA